MEMSEVKAVQIYDCWNRIGVWGKETPRCPKLEQVVHCRNCDVYTGSAAKLRERDIPMGSREEWTNLYTAGKETLTSGTEVALVFRLYSEWFALPAAIFEEITDVKVVHTVPHRTSNVFLGLVNIRGRFQLCVSIGSLLGLENAALQTGQSKHKVYPRMLVINKDSNKFVFPTDEVLGTYRFMCNSLKEIPATMSRTQATYSKGIFNSEERQIGRLDEELIFYTLARNLT